MNEKEGLSIRQDFLKKCANYYHADLYKAAFNEKTCKDLNRWVDKKTDGMIPQILDEMSQDAVMYLVNALAFDAKWEEPYKENQLIKNIFTTEDKKEQEVEFMYSEESKFITGDCADGFIKYYKDREYAFVALLPHTEISLEHLVITLDAKKLTEMLEHSVDITVYAAVPKYDSEYSVELSKALSTMGMFLSFDQGNANFNDLVTSDEGNIFISRVLHKTYISVAEKGTRAGAATVVEMKNETCGIPDKDAKTIELNRPFIYMLIDTKTNLPFFIGTVTELEK